MSCYLFSETLFGFAPFASRTFAELETKIRSSEPITVSKWRTIFFLVNLTRLKWNILC